MRAYAEHRHFLLKVHGALVVGLVIALPATISRFGLVGAIGVVVMTNALARGAILVKAIRILPVEPRDIGLLTDVAKIAAASAIAAVPTTLTRFMSSGLPPLVAVVVCGVCFGIGYAAAALALGVVTPEERDSLLDYVGRMTRRPSPRLSGAAPFVPE